MQNREKTKAVRIGHLTLGGNNRILIQSMCSIKTSKIEEVSAQINRCAALGADVMRLSCLDMEDALAFKEIKKRTKVVGVFPNPESCERLIGSLLMEQHEEWMEEKAYLTEKEMEKSAFCA